MSATRPSRVSSAFASASVQLNMFGTVRFVDAGLDAAEGELCAGGGFAGAVDADEPGARDAVRVGPALGAPLIATTAPVEGATDVGG